jgi:hypothetical protein
MTRGNVTTYVTTTAEMSEGLTAFLLVRPSCCTPSGTRTPNPLIKSQLLCQLS